MSLNSQQKKQLKELAHQRKPVVIVGKSGLSDSVLAEIDQALTHHELIKVKLAGADREQRSTLVATIVTATAAEEVQMIGNIVILYRAPAKGATVKIKLA